MTSLAGTASAGSRLAPPAPSCVSPGCAGLCSRMLAAAKADRSAIAARLASVSRRDPRPSPLRMERAVDRGRAAAASALMRKGPPAAVTSPGRLETHVLHSIRSSNWNSHNSRIPRWRRRASRRRSRGTETLEHAMHRDDLRRIPGEVVVDGVAPPVPAPLRVHGTLLCLGKKYDESVGVRPSRKTGFANEGIPHRLLALSAAVERDVNAAAARRRPPRGR